MTWFLLAHLRTPEFFDKAETEFKKALRREPQKRSGLNYYGYMLGDSAFVSMKPSHSSSARLQRALQRRVSGQPRLGLFQAEQTQRWPKPHCVKAA